MEKLHSARRLEKAVLSPFLHLEPLDSSSSLSTPPCPTPPSTLVGGLLIFWMTIWERKRAIASPAAALERAPRLLQILHGRSSLKPAVLEVQNYGRCGSNGAQIGRPVPLKSTAFKHVHPQRHQEPAGSCAACKGAQSLYSLCDFAAKACCCRGQKSPTWPRSGTRSCEVGTVGLLNSVLFLQIQK